MTGHFIYLGVKESVVILESGSLPDPPYKGIGRVGRNPVYRFGEGVHAQQVIEDAVPEGDTVGVLCLDDETKLELNAATTHNGRQVSVLGKEMLGRDGEGYEIKTCLEKVLKNGRSK